MKKGLVSTIDSIFNYLESQSGSPMKNQDAVYLIAAILNNCDYEYYGPEEILQEAQNFYINILVNSKS